MAITSFYKIAGHNNTPGFYDFIFIEDDSVLFMPDPVNGVIDFDSVVLAEGAQFKSGYATLNTLNLGDESQQSANGITCPAELSGSTPIVNNLNLSLFSELAQKRYILLCQDNNGRYYVAGEPNNGLIFSFKRKGSALDFSFKAVYSHVCWEANGNVLVDGSIIDTGDITNCNCPDNPGGGGESGGIVTIKRTGGTTISTVTAPAEYTVADTVVRVRDSANNVLSTNNVKAADSPVNVSAPDASAVLKDTAGVTISTTAIKSNESKDISAPDARINIRNTVPTLIETIDRRSGQTSDYVFPETYYNLKNSADDLLSSDYLHSGVESDVVVPDTPIVVKNTAASSIHAENVPSGVTKEIVITDSTAVIKDSTGAILKSETIPAEASEDIVIDDATLALNGAAWRTVKAEESANVALVDENGTSITPLVADATQIKVNINASLLAYMIGDN